MQKIVANADAGDMDTYYGAQAEVFRNWGLSFKSRLKSPADRLAYERDIHCLEATIEKHVSGLGTVVEVGCGPSKLRSFGGNRQLILIDRVPAMLREARNFHGDHLRVYVQADGRQLPLANAAAALVVCTFMLSHLDEDGSRRAVREIQRVLSPGGIAIVADSVKSMVPTRALPTQRRTAADGRTYSVPKYYRNAHHIHSFFAGGEFAVCEEGQFVFTVEWRNV